MALNTLFPRKKELVNYDYFDIAEGTGVSIFYGAEGDNGEYYVSSNATLYSENIATSKVDHSLSGTAAKEFDIDFDITFNRPKNIKGKIIANVPMGVTAKTDNTQTVEYYAVVKAVHWDGSTETTLATGTSKTNTTPDLRTSLRQYDSDVMMCIMDVSTIQHFKKGETLRLTVEGWYRVASGSGQTYISLGHDPKNREWRDRNRGGNIPVANAMATEDLTGGTVEYQNTQMIFHVPFRLDV